MAFAAWPVSSTRADTVQPKRRRRRQAHATRIQESLQPHQRLSSFSKLLASTQQEHGLSIGNYDDNEGWEPRTSSDDTIFALSSGMGLGGQATAVAVIRISGPHALAALQQLTWTKNKTPRSFPPRMATLVNLQYQGRLLDQALVLYFPQPHSFTGQDIVELHTHGSRAVLQDVMTVLERMEIHDTSNPSTIKLRYAEAGEFTSRAFTAGKLDVLQVEALADLLAADTILQKQQALSQLQGDLSKVYTAWKSELIGCLAHAEAIIDFGDDEHLGDNDEMDNELEIHKDAQKQAAQDSLWGGVTQKVQALRQGMQLQLDQAQRGEWVRQGFQMAIVGRPNAGKSSLFNILAQDEQAAIVSPVQGTTRDVLSVNLNLGGMKCRLSDTAGLRDATNDIIEQEGMKRAQKVASQADLVLVLVDAATLTRNCGGEEISLLLQHELDRLAPVSELAREKVVLVLNKVDLLQGQDNCEDNKFTLPVEEKEKLAAMYTISCQTQQGMTEFLQGLTNHVLKRVMGSQGGGEGEDPAQNHHQEDPLMTRGRHRQHVEAACDALERFEVLQRDGLVTVDMAAEELRLAASELGRLTGAIDVEDVLDQLFTDFCIGK